MLHPFNRKELFKTPSAQDAARAWSILRANGIPYAVTTKGTGVALRRRMDLAIVSKNYNGATNYNDAVDSLNYLYVIYVHRKDYQRAMELIG
ncbi:MAG: hypothetical protein K2O11_02420 [Oscillospiraceae bacterium]|nr:hypothetical protein [Oscillospiraceae bacterium]